jgi:hypothetical protein
MTGATGIRRTPTRSEVGCPIPAAGSGPTQTGRRPLTAVFQLEE